MRDKPLKTHIWSRAELQVETDGVSHFQSTFDRRLEVPAQRAGAVVGEEFEDLGADGLSMVCCFRFDWEKQVGDSSRDEADEESAVVDDDVLYCC